MLNCWYISRVVKDGMTDMLEFPFGIPDTSYFVWEQTQEAPKVAGDSDLVSFFFFPVNTGE